MTTTTAMMMTNVDDEALGASAWHFYIMSCDGADNNNYGNDVDECPRPCLMRKRMAFSYCVAQMR
jgi:hypothetical protein